MKTFKIRGGEAREVIERALASVRERSTPEAREWLDRHEPALRHHLDQGGDHAACAVLAFVVCSREVPIALLTVAADLALGRAAATEAARTDQQERAKLVRTRNAAARRERYHDEVEEKAAGWTKPDYEAIYRQVAKAEWTRLANEKLDTKVEQLKKRRESKGSDLTEAEVERIRSSMSRAPTKAELKTLADRIGRAHRRERELRKDAGQS